MNPRTRRKRAIVRDRRRGWHGITPLIGPLNEYDLFLIRKYYPVILPREGEMLRRIFPEFP